MEFDEMPGEGTTSPGDIKEMIACELVMLHDDLVVNIMSAAAAAAICGIIRTYIGDGFVWKGVLPLLEGDHDEMQQRLVGSFIAASFYMNRSLKIATERVGGHDRPTQGFDMDRLQALHEFSQALMKDFTEQFRIHKGMARPH